GPQLRILQNSDAVAVGGDGEFYGLGGQIAENGPKVRMHAVLAGSEVHGAERQAFDDGLHLIERETIGAGGVAVAKGAGEIALVGESESQGDTVGRDVHDSRSVARGRRWTKYCT